MRFGAAAFPVGAEEREHQHGQEDDAEAYRGLQDSALALGEDGEAAVDEFDVDPVDEKRGFSELDDRTETHLGKAPAAPSINTEENDQENAAAHQEKVGAGVPVVVDGVEMNG